MNQQANIEFKQLERITVALNLGGPVDIEIVKQGNSQTELDENNAQLLWHVADLHSQG